MAKTYILLSDINCGERIFKAGNISSLPGVPANEIPSLISNRVIREATQENIISTEKEKYQQKPEEPVFPSKAERGTQRVSGDDTDDTTEEIVEGTLVKGNVAEKYDAPKRGRPKKAVE